MMSSFKHYGMLCVKGMAMGAADVVPGVSGGTIAFIVGIYEELIDTIRSFNPTTVKILFKEGPSAFWQAVNGGFLVSLMLGIGISIISLARIVTYLLDNHPILIWSFFFGLILSSIIYMIRQISAWQLSHVVSLLVGTAVAYTISIAPVSEAPKELWFVFLSGSIAICAMILPGISGSFILLLLGMYSYILTSIKELQLAVLLTFAGGCAVGLLSFAHFLSWLLKNYHSLTVALLTGFLVGSLNVVWPWKVATQTMIDRHGKEISIAYERVLPTTYETAVQSDSYLLPALALMIVGVVLVLGLEKLGSAEA